MPNRMKVSSDQWVATAKQALIDHGVAGVRIDQLARRLGVTRGGFYHHFQNHDELLQKLLAFWARSNDFLPDCSGALSAKQAQAKIEEMTENLISEQEFSPAFDMAVREWARIDPSAKRTVDRIDRDRIKKITKLFADLGYDADEALVRAKVLYFHQIGFYSLGYHQRQSEANRRKETPIYLRILCGPLYRTDRKS